jgi:hypothetical protein
MSDSQGIGWAVKQMHNGSHVRRAGWNGPGQYLELVYNHSLPTAAHYVALRTVQGGFIPWTCSQADLLGIDWEIAE